MASIPVAATFDDNEDYYNFFRDYFTAKKQEINPPAISPTAKPPKKRISPYPDVSEIIKPISSVDMSKINDMPVGEAIEKGISPQGMIATWSEERRKEYELCVEPHIKTYKFAIDKINREAEKNYEIHTNNYLISVFGAAGLAEVVNAFKGDKAVRARWNWKSLKGTGIGVARVTFWITFSTASITYIMTRRTFLKYEALDFISQTNYFFERLNECRKKYPYDAWRETTESERKNEDYFKKLVFTNTIIHPVNTRPTKLFLLPIPE
jgi:hypothetical protein